MPIASFVTALPHRLLIALALMISMHAQALTLGRVQGAALIGRPLAVTVQVQLDANQSITSACFEADVFHADTRQNPAGVTVRLEPTAVPQSANLRITSSSRVDEPIVTVYVRAGCAQMSSRRYVLLADIVSEQADPLPRVASVPLVDATRLSAAPAASDAGTRASVSTPLAAAQSGAGSNAAVRSAARNQARAATAQQRQERAERQRAAPARPAPATRAVAKPAAPSANAAKPAATATAPERGTGQSRLKLDPLEMLSERVATLESNATTTPAQLNEREAREVERLERLETSVKALLALAAKNEASLLDVRNRLEKAQTDRFSNTVIYALFALLLLSLLAIAYLLARINRSPEVSGSRWFDAAKDSAYPDSTPPPPMPHARSVPAALQDAGPPPASSPAPLVDSGPAPFPVSQLQTDRLPIEPTRPMPHDAGVPGAAMGNAQVDVSLVEMSESTFDRLMQSGASHSAIRRAHETVPMAMGRQAQDTPQAAPRSRIDAEELIDIRQRAEFFVTLGQTDQAVQVLEARIAQDSASCPQAFLDLFKLFHSLGLKADFNQLREDFERLFNCSVPEFSDFDNEGRTLEAYPGAVDHLIRDWRLPTVLDTLERMIFAGAAVEGGEAGQEVFDLAAFRDLLMLHAVAQTVRAGSAGRSGAVRPPPIAGAQDNQVDIDLSELFSAEGAPTLVLPEIDARAGDAGGLQVQAPADGEMPGQAGPPSQSDNLIDFDLNDVDFAKKPGDKGT